MQLFVAPNPTMEVSGEALLSFLKSMPTGIENRLSILEKCGIHEPEEGKWYPAQKLLDAYKFIQEYYGEMNVFLIGKVIIENAKFPPFKNLEEGLLSINIAYHMNHRVNGKALFSPITGKTTDGIGYYKLVLFDEKARKAAMVCSNPYPTRLDVSVIQDSGSPMRMKGEESDTFIIKW